MASVAKPCKDCPPNTKRPAPYPGPRCATHHRQVTRDRKKANHERSVQKTYGLEAGDYDRLYAEQGGLCAICRRARGISRRLAVDHNHVTGRVRGLLCSPCNQFIGYIRDEKAAFKRGYDYLERDELSTGQGSPLGSGEPTVRV